MSENRNRVKEKIERYISENLDGFFSEYAKKLCAEAVERGGKRVRAIISYCFSRGLGLGEKTALEIAYFVELTHAFTLVHDDIIDLAESRRGKPSIWKKYGTPLAILAGDELFVYAFERLSKISSPKAIFFALNWTRRVVEGQILDVLWSSGRREGEVIDIQMMKTASLFKISCVLPVWIAFEKGKVSDFPKTLRVFDRFSTHFGLAFQISDDFQDIEEDRKNASPNIVLEYGRDKALMIFEREVSNAEKYFQKISDIIGRRWSSPVGQIIELVRERVKV